MSEFVLECNGICKSYSADYVLKDFTLNLERGKIMGLLGPNGSGKTTLIKIICGLLMCDKGGAKICGEIVSEKTCAMVSYLPDHNYLAEWMKVGDAVSFFSDFYEKFDSVKAYEMLSTVKILPDTKIKALSKGNREKAQLILVMSRNADLYVLDEPIASVDPAARDYILNTIITNYCDTSSIILSTHLISDVERILDDVVFIRDGGIILKSTVDNIRESEGKSVDSLFREVYKC